MVKVLAYTASSVESRIDRMGLVTQKHLFYLDHKSVRFLLVSHPQPSGKKFFLTCLQGQRSAPFWALGPGRRATGKHIDYH
jgi:hypothetical protein